MAPGSVARVNADTLGTMSDETMGLVAGGLAVVAALIVFSMLRAAARGHLDRNSGFGLVTPAVKKSDATWTAGHLAALPVARRTVLATVVVWVAALVVGLVVGEKWAGYLGLVPYLAVILGFVPMVRTANAAAVEATKKTRQTRKSKPTKQTRQNKQTKQMQKKGKSGNGRRKH